MSIKSEKMKISKNKKMCFFLMSQGSLNPKVRFLGQKVCSVARERTDTHESDYCGHPFRVSGVFPSTIIKDRPKISGIEKKNTYHIHGLGSGQVREKCMMGYVGRGRGTGSGGME